MDSLCSSDLHDILVFEFMCLLRVVAGKAAFQLLPCPGTLASL